MIRCKDLLKEVAFHYKVHSCRYKRNASVHLLVLMLSVDNKVLNPRPMKDFERRGKYWLIFRRVDNLSLLLFLFIFVY